MDATKINLLNSETQLEFLPRLTQYLNGPKIYIKRDDKGGRGGGGNKLRKYERLIGEALSKNCDTLIIAGHYQSNAARELVGSACQMGLKSIVVCKELIPSQNDIFLQNGNALLMNLMDANIISISKDADFVTEMNKIAENIQNEGGKPYIIPFGGSNVMGVWGYVDCAEEIITQLKQKNENAAEYVFVPTGSGGTQAGLIAGFEKHQIKTNIIGISVLHKKQHATAIVENLTREISSDLKINVNSNVIIDDTFVGDGYGIPTKECIDTIKLVAKLEGIFLDPVYTGKAMAGLISYIQSNKIPKTSNVIFIHTGGSPLIYAYYNKLFQNNQQANKK
jgi:D-cysteine desulfhydrase family pyridoxal phosphate-dependent enzyme